MTTATVDLYEDVRLSKPSAPVDRARGLIPGVKILGLTSSNGRRYLREAVAAAKDKYEGKRVYLDHAPGKGRSVRDTFGWIENVTVRDDGLYGDFRAVNPASDLAVSLMNAADNKPDLFGFSHHANGRVKRVNGEDVVESIDQAFSVDLVNEPATTKGLREGKEPMHLKDYYRALADRLTEARHAPLKGRLAKLLEDDAGMMPMADAPVPDDAPSDPDEALKAGFKAACMAVIDDDSMDMQGKLAKLREILKAQEKLMSTGKETDKPAGDATPDESAKPPAGNLTEAQLRAELDVRDLIEESGLKFAKPEHRRAFVKALVPLTEAERKTLVEAARAGATAARPATPPRSGPATPLTESAKKWPDPNDIEAVAKRVRG